MQKKIGLGIGVLLILIVVFSLSFSFVAKSNNVYAKTSSQLKAEQAAAKRKIAQNKLRQQAILNLILDSKQQKTLLSKYKDKTSSEYKDLQAQKQYILEQERKIQGDIVAAQNDLDQKTLLLQERIRVMYENSTFSYLQVILESKGLLDFFDRMELVQSIVAHDQALMEEVKTAKLDLNYKLQARQEQRAATQKAADEKMKYINQLEASTRDIAKKILDSNEQLKEYQKKENELEAESKKIDNDIKNLTQGNGGTYHAGKLWWPIPGGSHVIDSGSGFGMRLHPIFKTWKMHSGVDIRASMGQTIIAVGDGTVISASYRSGYGNTVIINHGGGITTLYAHCSQLLVSTGENVKQGDTIAKAGSTGWSTGAHLHFEVRRNGTAIDPMKGWIG